MGMQASVGRRRAPVWLALGAAAAVGGGCVPVARGRVTPMAPDVRGVVCVGGAPRAGVPLRLVVGAGGECTPPAAEDTSGAGGAWSGTYSIDVAVPADSAASRER